MAKPNNYTIRNAVRAGKPIFPARDRRKTHSDHQTDKTERKPKQSGNCNPSRIRRGLSELHTGTAPGLRGSNPRTHRERFAATAIMEAVRHYTEHNDPKAKKRTVTEVLAEFLESKSNAGLSTFTLTDYGRS